MKRNSGRVDFNLAHRPFLDTRRIELLSAVLLAVSVLLAVYNAAAWIREKGEGAGAESIGSQETKIRLLEEEIDTAKKGMAGAVSVDSQKELDLLNGLIAQRTFSWVRMLARLERALPSDVALSNLSPQVRPSDGMVDLAMNAVSQTPDGMLRFIENLYDDPAFSEPFPAAERDQEKSGNPEGREFNLRVRYDPTRADAPLPTTHRDPKPAPTSAAVGRPSGVEPRPMPPPVAAAQAVSPEPAAPASASSPTVAVAAPAPAPAPVAPGTSVHASPGRRMSRPAIQPGGEATPGQVMGRRGLGLRGSGGSAVGTAAAPPPAPGEEEK